MQGDGPPRLPCMSDDGENKVIKGKKKKKKKKKRMKKIYSKLKALERSQHFIHYKFISLWGFFQTLKGR